MAAAQGRRASAADEPERARLDEALAAARAALHAAGGDPLPLESSPQTAPALTAE
jgi:hypothetical protein